MGCSSSSSSFSSSSKRSIDQSELSISKREQDSIRSISYDKVNNSFRIKKSDYDVGLNKVKNKTLLSKSKNDSYKVLTSMDAHKMIAQKNLKAALTHPTILKYFNKYMDEVDGTKYLKFYLDSTFIRETIKNDDYSYAHQLMALFVKTYFDDRSSSFVEIREKQYNLLIQTNKVINEHKDDGDNHDNNDSLRKSNTYIWVEAMRMAQYEVFFIIQDKFWLPFCESDLYNEMCKKKEVRTMISLYKNDYDDNNTKTLSDSFSGLGLRS